MSGVNWNTAGIVFTILATNFGGFFYLLNRMDDQHQIVRSEAAESRKAIKSELDDVIENQQQQTALIMQEIDRSVEKTRYIVQPQLDVLSMTIEFQNQNNKKIADDMEKIDNEIEKVDQKAENMVEKLEEKVVKDVEEVKQKTEQLEEDMETVIRPAIAPKD